VTRLPPGFQGLGTGDRFFARAAGRSPGFGKPPAKGRPRDPQHLGGEPHRVPLGEQDLGSAKVELVPRTPERLALAARPGQAGAGAFLQDREFGLRERCEELEYQGAGRAGGVDVGVPQADEADVLALDTHPQPRPWSRCC